VGRGQCLRYSARPPDGAGVDTGCAGTVDFGVNGRKGEHLKCMEWLGQKLRVNKQKLRGTWKIFRQTAGGLLACLSDLVASSGWIIDDIYLLHV